MNKKFEQWKIENNINSNFKISKKKRENRREKQVEIALTLENYVSITYSCHFVI